MNTAAETKNILYKVRERIPDKIRESKPKLLEQVRITLRTLHYSRKTEEAYIKWIKELILFNNKTHPKDLSKEHIEKFLSHLAVKRMVSASTQKQALSAILFLYRNYGQHKTDLKKGKGRTKLPYALAAKYPNADTEFGWQYVFPADKFIKDKDSGLIYRYHIHESTVQKLIRDAVKKAKVLKHGTSHTFRHSPREILIGVS